MSIGTVMLVTELAASMAWGQSKPDAVQAGKLGVVELFEDDADGILKLLTAKPPMRPSIPPALRSPSFLERTPTKSYSLPAAPRRATMRSRERSSRRLAARLTAW